MTADARKPPEIEKFHRVSPAGGNGQGRPAEGPAGRGRRVSDRVAALRNSAEIGSLVDAVRALPDVRDDKVAAIRKAIESGTYVVNSARVAQKMIDEMG